MGGRRQFDNQTSIMAIPKVDSVNIQAFAGSVATINAGAYASALVYPASGQIMKVEALTFDVRKFSTLGAASGDFSIEFFKKDIVGGQLMRIGKYATAYNKDLQMLYMSTMTTLDADLITKYPASAFDFMKTIRGLKFDINNPLEIRVTNNTPANIVGVTCSCRIAVTYEEVSN